MVLAAMLAGYRPATTGPSTSSRVVLLSVSCRCTQGATHDHPLTLGDAIARFLGSGDFAASTIESYQLTLEGLLDDLGADVRSTG
jgi:hypothetical protein